MEHRSTTVVPRTGWYGERTEETMCRSRRTEPRMIRIQVRFEMSRMAAACLADAYEQVVPVPRRSTGRDQGQRRSEGQRRAEGGV
jgi:hypothetical protein